MKYFIIAGEASGDLHGGPLVKHLKMIDESADIEGWGGIHMEEAGMKKHKDYKELAFMGFIEVIKHLPTIRKNFIECKQQILQFQPDVVIFIDYPGFNLRMAKWAKKKGFKTVYYISPQIWAWKENRIRSIKKHIDKMLVILPFETTFYKKHQFEAEYVGHPLTHTVLKSLYKPFPEAWGVKPIIAVLPGSRAQEVETHLEIIERVVSFLPNYEFYIAKVPHLDLSIYKPFLNQPNLHIVENKTHELYKLSEAALVASGTATLEAALFGVPQVVYYKGNWISFQLAKQFIKVPYISLVNLILDKPAVEELIQDDCNPSTIVASLQRLFQEDNADQLQSDYTKLWDILGSKNAALEAAKAIFKTANTL